MIDIITSLLFMAGAAFLLLAAVGVVKMPDLFARMHATTKAATLGTSFMLLAVAIHFGELGIAVRSIAVIIFMYITAPVVAHIIGRAAHYIGVPLWKGTIIDEFGGRQYSKSGKPGATEPVNKTNSAVEDPENPNCG